MKSMEKIVSLCKRRGFLFQSSEIYGGVQGFWDYGPLGVELKRNLKEAWWQDMITGHNDLMAPADRLRLRSKWSAWIAPSSCTLRCGSAAATTICSTTTWSIVANQRGDTGLIRFEGVGVSGEIEKSSSRRLPRPSRKPMKSAVAR